MAAAVGLLAAWLAYGRSRGASSSPITWLTAALRAAAVTIVAALLFGAPRGAAAPRAPLLAVDVSASWRRAAGDDSTFARNWRRQLADTVRAVLASDVPILLIGDSARDVSADELTTILPSDAASRVRPAVDRAASLGRSLVLITDGDADDADALAEAPPGSRAVRVSGGARRDVAVADLQVPVSVTGGDTVSASVTVTAGAIAAESGTLRLRVDGGEVASTSLPPLAPFASTRLTVPFVTARGDRVALVQAVADMAGDAEPRNDTLTVAMEVGDRPSAVFVSTAPDIDVREVLTVLRGALDVPTKAYLRVAPGIWRVEGTLAPISEADVKARAATAGMLIVHGDTSWRAGNGPAGGSAAARALWVPAPPTQIARAGELTRTAEWYATAAPASPLVAALSALPFDSLPPVTLAGPAATGDAVLTMRLGKQGPPQPAIAAREANGSRTIVVSGSGYAGWALRGGRSREAFTALWGAIFDWVSAGRGDVRAARPVPGVVRAGEPVVWRRGGADSLVSLRLTPRRAAPQSGTSAGSDSLMLAFGSRFEMAATPLPAGVYDVTTAGGNSVLVVNASREWVPRAPVVPSGPLVRGSAGTDAPRLADAGWPFALALLLLCAEWIARRSGGQR